LNLLGEASIGVVLNLGDGVFRIDRDGWCLFFGDARKESHDDLLSQTALFWFLLIPIAISMKMFVSKRQMG
jgi:hypothetical protein